MRRCSDEQREPKFDRNRWTTPPYIYDPLNSIFHFGLDAAADCANTKCSTWFGEEGLFHQPRDKEKLPRLTAIEGGALGSMPWHKASKSKSVFLNPPHSGPLLRRFVARAAEEAGAVAVVCLLPATVEVRWFNDLVDLGTEISVQFVFIKGRVRYLNPDTKLPLAIPQVGALLAVLGATDQRLTDLKDLDYCECYSWRPVTP